MGLNLNNVNDNVRTAIARRKDWRKIKVSLDFTLTRHEIMLANVVMAENQEEMEKAYNALQRAIHDEGGFHSNRKLGTVELKAGDFFTIECKDCGMTHQGIIEDGPVLGRVICDKDSEVSRTKRPRGKFKCFPHAYVGDQPCHYCAAREKAMAGEPCDSCEEGKYCMKCDRTDGDFICLTDDYMGKKPCPYCTEREAVA